jgi:hypothetical protein
MTSEGKRTNFVNDEIVDRDLASSNRLSEIHQILVDLFDDDFSGFVALEEEFEYFPAK